VSLTESLWRSVKDFASGIQSSPSVQVCLQTWWSVSFAESSLVYRALLQEREAEGHHSPIAEVCLSVLDSLNLPVEYTYNVTAPKPPATFLQRQTSTKIRVWNVTFHAHIFEKEGWCVRHFAVHTCLLFENIDKEHHNWQTFFIYEWVCTQTGKLQGFFICINVTSYITLRQKVCRFGCILTHIQTHAHLHTNTHTHTHIHMLSYV